MNLSEDDLSSKITIDPLKSLETSCMSFETMLDTSIQDSPLLSIPNLDFANGCLLSNTSSLSELPVIPPALIVQSHMKNRNDSEKYSAFTICEKLLSLYLTGVSFIC